MTLNLILQFNNFFIVCGKCSLYQWYKPMSTLYKLVFLNEYTYLEIKISSLKRVECLFQSDHSLTDNPFYIQNI